jgi:hypothetical protein
VGAEEFDGNGTKIVKDIDPRCLGRLALCKNAGPKVETGVMAEFHGGET